MVGSTFQVLDGVVLRPVPWPRSDRLDEMPLQAVVPIFSRAEVADLRTLAASESLDAYSLRVFTIAQPGEARQVEGGRATGSLFGTLAASAAAGRLLAHRDSEPGGGPVAVLSNGYWRDAYGGESRVLGSTIDIVDEAGAVHAYTIVGVLPRNAAIRSAAHRSGFP